nr:hypothetical protein [Ralstonia solanacearum]
MASAARADTDLTALPLEQLMQVQVTSVSKYAQPVSEAPSSVSVITAADMGFGEQWNRRWCSVRASVPRM